MYNVGINYHTATMLKTYVFGANLKFKDAPKNAYGYEVGLAEVGELPQSTLEGSHQEIAQEWAALRASVSVFDIQGVAWVNTHNGEVKRFGCMTDEFMEYMDKALPKLISQVV